MKNEGELNSALVVGLIPYFLEKPVLWFEKNLNKILEARRTQTFFEDNTLFLERNQKYNFSQFLRKLDEIGYEKVLQVSEPGEFSQRGGIIDLFPINPVRGYKDKKKAQSKQTSNGVNLYAIRFEFLGNKIENIEKLPIEVRDEISAKEILKKKLKSQRLFSDLKGLKSGNYLVHLDHGIGRFLGITTIPQISVEYCHGNIQQQKAGIQNVNYYKLEYAQGDKLYVPVGLERKLSRYIGFVEPRISRLGSLLWQKTKKKIKEGAEKLAKELLEIYAKREITTRPPYLPADEIDSQLASSFQYLETPDQIQVIEEIKKDLESDLPMDRLLCGDVGFGKTEVALRAMIKTVKSGYQVAMICPTTILANQHFQNFKERLKNLPIKITMLSRLQSKREQKEVIEGLKKGEIDIVIGTHRLLSKDVEFSTAFPPAAPRTSVRVNMGLGLLVIDDEQRFGVRQKEKLKKMRSWLDVLSLSATPIPRTLYMALSSLKNISLIQTPPVGRLPIKTFILPFKDYNSRTRAKLGAGLTPHRNGVSGAGPPAASEVPSRRAAGGSESRSSLLSERAPEIIKKAIKNEILRGGQVYYLHNRVETIETAKKFLENLVPEAKFGIAHGRLKEKELVKVMSDFQNQKIDVLVATTIIENGLDLPNVNTLIVADATKLGLAQAYQIRGRIGRSHIQAFAYFLYGSRLSGNAKIRLDALKEAEELGSGYKIALKDLEIRGAGNILGKEQSGNINQVGLNLYCQMLSEAIDKLRIVRPAPQ